MFQLENLLQKCYHLNRSGQEGYKAYVRAYASHSLKNIFDVNQLDLKQVALSFGFKVKSIGLGAGGGGLTVLYGYILLLLFYLFLVNLLMNLKVKSFGVFLEGEGLLFYAF